MNAKSNRQAARTGTGRQRTRAPRRHIRNWLICLCIAGQVTCAAEEPTQESIRHPYDGFTRPYRTIQVAAGDFGRVAEVTVKPGDTVTKGQTLLKLDTSVLEVTRRRAAADAASISKIKSLTVEHNLATRRLESLKTLGEGGRGSLEELLRAEANEQIALFKLQEAEEYREQLKIELEEIDARIRTRHVLSPIDGNITQVLREVGEYVPTSAPEVATIVDLSRLRATFFLPTKDALILRPNTRLQLTMQTTDQTVSAVVERVGAVTEANSGRVRVEMVIENQERRYRSGISCILESQSLEHARANADRRLASGLRPIEPSSPTDWPLKFERMTGSALAIDPHGRWPGGTRDGSRLATESPATSRN